MFLFGSIFCSFYFAVLVVAPLPPPASPGTDACGPFDHTGDATVSTCSSAVTSGGPAPYGTVCGIDSNITIPTRISWCAGTAQSLCYMLGDGQLTPGEWHWTADGLQAPCRAGIYLSNQPGAAPRPNYRRCLNQIFQRMIYGCIDGTHNVATVNIRELPNVARDNPGRAVNAGYHSYILSPMALWPSQYPPATANVYGDPRKGVRSVSPNLTTAYNGGPWDPKKIEYDSDEFWRPYREAAIRASSGPSVHLLPSDIITSNYAS
ncbi:MAG: hypothetical protein Q9219_002209 [cf. Caloplaca sp. 3 TL-2023]